MGSSASQSQLCCVHIKRKTAVAIFISGKKKSKVKVNIPQQAYPGDIRIDTRDCHRAEFFALSYPGYPAGQS
jgi:hypothetical protein